MNAVINLDISRSNKPTNVGLKVNEPQTLYFRIYDEFYKIDYSDISGFQIEVRVNSNSKKYIYTLNPLPLQDVQGESLVYWSIPSNLLEKKDKLYVTVKVRYKTNLKQVEEFKILVFEELYIGELAMIQNIDRFNKIIASYLDKVKRLEINNPNGIIGLNSEGKINENLLPLRLLEHTNIKLVDTINKVDGIHGLKINNQTYQLMYYDRLNNTWSTINKPQPEYLYGGTFTGNNSTTLFGGTFTEVNNGGYVFGGKF